MLVTREKTDEADRAGNSKGEFVNSHLLGLAATAAVGNFSAKYGFNVGISDLFFAFLDDFAAVVTTDRANFFVID